MNFPKDVKIRDLKKYSPFEEIGKYINYAPGISGFLNNNLKLNEVSKNNWNKDSILYGLNRMEQVASNGKCLYRIYSDIDCMDDKFKADVNVVFMPKTVDKGSKPFIIICPGGAYVWVCALVEGYPVASRFNDLGYDVFILNYRVGKRPLMPKPLDDLAAAVNYIFANRENFKVSDSYIVCGFSAGGNLTALWGTDNHGWIKYGVKKPLALIPVYPFISHEYNDFSKTSQLCVKAMFGNSPSQEIIEDYDVDRHMSRNYPPCYILCGENDDIIDPRNSSLLKMSLDDIGILSVLEEGQNAPHGFNEGRGTDVEGWPSRADEFISTLA